jgi:hypothetical protein
MSNSTDTNEEKLKQGTLARYDTKYTVNIVDANEKPINSG